MPEYLSPGVYVEEVDRGPKPIEGVGTAMAAFVGFTEKAELVREIDGEMVVENLLNHPQLVTNWTQFVERFGGFVPGINLPQSVYGYFMNGGSRCYVASVRTFPKAEAVLINSQGKPALSVRARQAGVEGLKLRVRVADMALPATASSSKKATEDEKSAEEPEDSGPGGDYSFTLFVEKETMSAVGNR
jgi:phage tail sheath protein FI